MTQQAIDDFKESGLTFAHLEREGLVRYVAPDELSSLFPSLIAPSAVTGGVELRYYALSEANTPEPIDYARYKVYWRPTTGFAAQAKDSRPKYIQPAQTPNHLYIPPVCDWATVLEDSSQTIAITEGEKKTIALCERGIPTVGLGGVSSLGNKKRGQQVIPELKQLCSGGRSILVIFDIDEGFTTMKPEVARAAFVLCNVILEYGGVPKIVTLPSDGSKKCAVDDWLRTHELTGFGLYEELARNAKIFDTAVALYEEASKYVYIEDSNALGKISTREAVMVSDYRVSSGNRQVVMQELVLRRQKNAPPTTAMEIVVRPLSEAFLRWGSRPNAKSTSYEPGNPHYLTSRGEFNQWKGWAQPTPEQVKEEDVEPLWNAFQALYREDALTMWNWFMYPIARPGAKWVMIPVIQAEEEGIGKSSIPAFFAKFVYGEGYGTPNNATTLNAMSLKDGRLEFMVRKQFLFLDDANDIHGNDVEALLKNIATSDSVRANPKYLRSYECKNTVNLCITTNRTMPFKIPPQDRRLFLPYTSLDVLPTVWHELHKWGRAGGGGKVVAYAQQLFDVEAVDPNMKAPMTQKKLDIVGISRSPIENFLFELKHSAEAGQLRRVVFTARELRTLAEYEGDVRSAHDVGPMILNRGVKLVGGKMYGSGGYRVSIEGKPETVYVFAEFDKWKVGEALPQDVAKEIKENPLDVLRVPRSKGGKAKVVRMKG